MTVRSLLGHGPLDPRLYQITTLAFLLLYGVTRLDFQLGTVQAIATLAAALTTQVGFALYTGQPVRGSLPSALISGLSLCLLLRTNHAMVACIAACLAIASKFAIRVGSKHVFNPTNGALVAMMLMTNQVWVSPGQWGDTAFLAFFLACLGGLVVNRASRSDITYAFLAFHLAILIARSTSLGEPLAIAWHRFQNGAFLLFAFFMISDPKTTPDSRTGRILFALLVALGAGYIQFVLFRPNGLLWALAAAAPLVPVLDRLLPGRRYRWCETGLKVRSPLPERLTGVVQLASRSVRWWTQKGTTMKPLIPMLVLTALLSSWGVGAEAFCGFYVAKADTKLFNKASQVVLVRDGDRTVITMASDYRGNPREFAMVIPVPTPIQRDQIHVANKGLLDHLEGYTSPRLVEYYDDNPCLRPRAEFAFPAAPRSQLDLAEKRQIGQSKSLGVTVEAQYSVGEYDILILSATQSRGLETWLKQNGYRIPEGASRILDSYIKQQMRFFVARVNVEEQERLGLAFLRPLQIAFESPKFMLPIRLGTVNADGAQELFVYALTPRGRVETTNYQTVRLPSDVELPVFLKDDGEFPKFYRALFDAQVEAANGQAVFLEYAWDMSWCDPCAADPLGADELRQLGVFWLERGVGNGRGLKAGAQDVFVTRLHIRYDAAHFPEDLVFQETADRTNVQSRYVLRHAWQGAQTCAAAREYSREVLNRQENEARTLAALTGWNLTEIRNKMGLGPLADRSLEQSWWRRLWNR